MTVNLKKSGNSESKRTVSAFFAVCCLVAFQSAYAGMRIKTVEYNFGGYYSAVDCFGGAAGFTFPTRMVKLPEDGKIIRSAWLEYEGFVVNQNKNANPLTIYFDAGASATTARLATAQYTDNTGESIRVFGRANVTAAVNAELANLAAGRQFTARVAFTVPDTNAHTMKLYVTYEYDDASAVQVKTVKFPLYSDYTNKIAAFTGQLASGATGQMQYLAEIADSGFAMQQQWFEIRGFRQNSGGADGSVWTRIGTNANEPAMNLSYDWGDSYDFRYISSSTIVQGFSTGTVQIVNVLTSQSSMNTLSGEVAITYECSGSVGTKTQTVSYYLGQSTDAAVNAYFQSPLFLREEGITLKRVYGIIHGSYDSATAGYPAVNARIGSAVVPQATYAIQSAASQISGYRFIHDMTAGISGWTNGEVVSATFTAVSNAGGATGAQGMELVMTYDYTNDSAHTAGYKVQAGSDTTGTDGTYAMPFNTYVPEGGGSKVIRYAYIMANAMNNSATQDFTTTVNFNGNSPLAVVHRTVTEAALVTRLYNNVSQAQDVSAISTVTANYSLSSNAGALGGQAGIVYTFVPVPKNPVSLAQKKSAGGSIISQGTYINQTNVRFEAVMASSMTSDSLYLIVEVKPNGSGFDGADLSTGTLVSYSGTQVTGVVEVQGLAENTYHWRARVLGDGGSGDWVNMGGNPDFGVDLSSPTAPVMAVIIPGDGYDSNTGANIAFDWEDVTDAGGSGLKNYEVIAATATDFANVLFSSQPAGSNASAPSLAQNLYYWKVRSLDNSGNTGFYSSTRSFNMDLSSPSVNNYMSGGDLNWRKSAGTVYHLGFSDSGGSKLSKFQIKASTCPNSGCTALFDWVDISTGINSNAYDAYWQIGASTWSQLQSYATNYISVKTFDYSTNTYILNDAFIVLKDTINPTYTNNEQYGDLIWRKTERQYSVKFYDPHSKLAGAKYEIRTGAGGGGIQKKGWTDISGVGGPSFTSAWNLDFASAQDGATNYVNIEIYDMAGNTETIADAFKVLKDTTMPAYSNGEAGGDNIWRNASKPGGYNVYFYDYGAQLSSAAYQAWTESGRNGTKTVTLTSIPGVSGQLFESGWMVLFPSLREANTNYVSVDIYDIAGNTTTITDAFFVRKDTTVPSQPQLSAPDDGYMANSQFINFSWSSSSDSASGVSNYVLEIATAADFVTITYSTSPSGIQIATGPVAEQFYHWRVRAKDTAGNFGQYSSTRSFRIDLSTPAITNLMPLNSDAKWRKSNDGIYSVHFDDAGGSLLDKFEVKASTCQQLSCVGLTGWVFVSSGINSAAYGSDWQLPQSVWNALNSLVTSYISVRVFDKVGNSSATLDAFFVLKDTVPPSFTACQTCGAVWLKANAGAIYDLGFADSGGSKLDTLEYTAYTETGFGGTKTITWTLISSGPVNSQAFSSLWGIADSSWTRLSEGINYISVRSWDIAGSTGIWQDAFQIRKDTASPSLQNGKEGGDAVWRKTYGTLYNVYFADSGGSLLQGAEYCVWSDSQPSRSGVRRKDWYPINSVPINSASYITDWQVDFDSLVNGDATNYVSVRVWDIAGSTAVFDNVFYVRKDVTLPSINDNQSGDDTWRSSSGTLYNVGFNDDGGSLLSGFEIRVTSGPDGTGTVIKDWTNRFTAINQQSYSQQWDIGGEIWDALPGGRSYVGARVWDNAGSSQEKAEVFYVKKDTAPPQLNSQQSGDTVWRKTNSGTYNVVFTDYGGQNSLNTRQELQQIQEAEVHFHLIGTTGPYQYLIIPAIPQSGR